MIKVSGCVASALVVTALGAHAHLAPQQPPPVFRSSIEVVRVDVSVLDKDRRPIRDLTRDDFTILVDGTAQPIVVFVPVVLPPPETPTAPWMREVAPDVRTNGPGDPRLFVIIMDDFGTPGDPFQVQTGKKIARAVVEQLRDGDLAAVLFTMARSRRQELTTDRARLLQAIEQFNVGFSEMGGPNSGPGLVGAVSLRRTLRDASTYLRERPHNRGAIILICSSHGAAPDVNRLYDEMADQSTEGRANAANVRLGDVPIYWFTTAGLEGPRISRDGIDFDPLGYNVRLRELAARTGGRSVADTNAPADAVAAVIAENSVYYLIGYRPTYPVSDGRVRRVRVTVNRPDVTILPGEQQVRSPKLAKPPKSPPPSPLVSALADIVPRSDVPLRVTAASFASPAGQRRGGATAAVAVAVGIRRPAPDAPLRERVELLAKLLTLDAKTVASVQQEARLDLAPEPADVEFELLSRLDAKPGRYQLRVSVRSATLDETGSVYADVTIPDFAKPPLSLSGVVLGATPPPKSAPRQALAALLPVTPTTKREFTAADQAVAFVRVYQGGNAPLAPVDIRLGIFDGQGDQVTTRVDRLSAERFGSQRAADYTYQVPLQTLHPGPHLLTITASSGVVTSARADVRFRVR